MCRTVERIHGTWLVFIMGAFCFVGVNAGYARSAAAGQKVELPEARDLARQAKVRFPGPAPMMTSTEMKCDAAGDIYAVYSDNPEVVLNEPHGINRLPIRKISVDSNAVVSYPVPSVAGYSATFRIGFGLDGEGRLYALLAAYPRAGSAGAAPAPAFLITRYNADGTAASHVELGPVPGKRTLPARFGVFSDGSFVVAGIASAGGESSAYAAVYDARGNFVKWIPAPHSILARPHNLPGSAPTPGQLSALRQQAREFAQATKFSVPVSVAVSYTRVIGTSDGDACILWGTKPQRMYIVSPGGDVLRRFDVSAPAPGAEALQLAPLSPGRVFVQFSHIGTELPVGSADAGKLIEVLDTNAGRAVAAYRLPQGADDRALAGCAAAPNEFRFVRASEDGKSLTVLRYTPAAR